MAVNSILMGGLSVHYRADVVPLQNGVLANVIPICEEICWPNHTIGFGAKEGAVRCSLCRVGLEQGTKLVCKGQSV